MVAVSFYHNARSDPTATYCAGCPDMLDLFRRRKVRKRAHAPLQLSALRARRLSSEVAATVCGFQVRGSLVATQCLSDGLLCVLVERLTPIGSSFRHGTDVLRDMCRKETHCEFCDSTLPDWKSTLTPICGADAPAVMNVNFDGQTYSFEVKPGSAGYKQFTQAIREAFSLPEDSELNITFTCDEPSQGMIAEIRDANSSWLSIHVAASGWALFVTC